MTARCNREDLDPFGPFGDVVGLRAFIAGVAILLNAISRRWTMR